jgi:site-specific recombinase XerD
LDNGTDLYTIKELLGHTNIQTTMRYMHLTASRIDEIVNPDDALLEAKAPTIISKKIK